ncbi:MAG: biopolymer transport protein ExbD [Pseudoalteromonas tetraodonis]|jgi:biopolymer transport protein ExbD
MSQRLKSRRHTQELGTLAELNVTPLLDLAFVLLVIFMITAPFLAESSELVIPSSKGSNDQVNPESVFTISIDRNRNMDLEGVELEYSELEAGMRQLKQKNPKMGVIIRAHSELTVQDLVGVMDALRNAQVTAVSVVTKPGAPE